MSRVLIIDTSPTEAERCRSLLQKAAFEVDCCYSGAEAAGTLEESAAGTWSAVVLLWDIKGPPFAPELLVRWKTTFPQLPVVVVSYRWDARLAAQAASLGATDCLLKPLDAGRLRQAVRSAVAPANPHLPLVDELRRTILGDSPALIASLREIAKLIPHDERRLLLCAESGTGKELIARAVHDLGPRKQHPWKAVNVGAIPTELAESALFGHERGAFTGATDTHIGYLEQAGEGTLFLDEIGDLSSAVQAKLLRAIQEREFHRIKGISSIKFKAHLICATHRDLALLAHTGDFRLDLYHRLAEITVRVPALRERAGDVELLSTHFLDANKPRRRLSPEAREILKTYPFPGNVRELENLIHAACIRCEGDRILPHHLPLREMGVFVDSDANTVPSTPPWPERLLEVSHQEALRELTQAFDKDYLPKKYRDAAYSIIRAAAAAGMDRGTFTTRWEKCGLPPLNPRKEESGV